MAIFKGFRLQFVDAKTPGANVLYEAVGPLVLSLCEKVASVSTGSYQNPDPSVVGTYYTTEPENMAGLFMPQSEADYTSSLDEIHLFFPLTVARPLLAGYDSFYVRILNGSGAYAVTPYTVVNGQSVNGYFELYQSDGSFIGTGLYYDVQYYAGQAAFRAIAFVGTYTGDTVQSVTHRVEATDYDGGSFYLRAYTLPSARDADTVTFLNLCEQLAPEPTDPYSQGGESDTGGGTGNFDGTSVDVDFTSLPTLSAVDTGFITIYNPSLSQLQSLANYMWSSLFDLDTFKKLFADPMQAILGLSIVPGPVPNGGSQTVKVGNISTGITMTKAASQYIDIDCGTLNVEEFWGAYLDYEPYTKAEIFLPFIGVHQIAIDDIMNKAVHIKYHIDLLSGGCACEIKCGGSVLYTFIGSCAVSIPITGNDWTNVINGVISIASSIGTMVASGGASAPSSIASIASAAVNNLKPSVEKSGSIAGAGGLLAGKVPVLILTRPRQALPGKQNTFTGYPAFITRSLGALSGYTEVHSIRLSGIDGTESEIDEIEELLKGGVIL